MGKTADYVIDLLDEILDEPAERDQRYDWALGDPSEKTGRQTKLPFDGVWESRKLMAVVHGETGRTEQSRIYDERKIGAARDQGYTVVEIAWNTHTPLESRDRSADRATLESLLKEQNALSAGSDASGDEDATVLETGTMGDETVVDETVIDEPVLDAAVPVGAPAGSEGPTFAPPTTGLPQPNAPRRGAMLRYLIAAALLIVLGRTISERIREQGLSCFG